MWFMYCVLINEVFINFNKKINYIYIYIYFIGFNELSTMNL